MIIKTPRHLVLETRLVSVDPIIFGDLGLPVAKHVIH